jgi:uncharacterized protein YbaP (TraB family)
MHRLLFALALLFCVAPLRCADARPFQLLLATKGTDAAYFLPTIHQSTDAMRQRLAETLRCLPEIDAVVTEANLDDIAKFKLVRYSINENRRLGHRFPAELLGRLDDLSDKALPRAFPRKSASAADRMGMHPSHFLAILKSRVDFHILREHGIHISGTSFESLLRAHARERKIDEQHLEAVDAAAAAHAAIAPVHINAQADYLLRLWDDRRMRQEVYRAHDDMYALFERGDWTAANVQTLNAAMRAGQSDGYVASVVIKRTQDMMARFEALPRRDKPVLVAVGMGHFGKVDGIEAWLSARGYTLRYSSGTCPAPSH